jgi:hypothetical protein
MSKRATPDTVFNQTLSEAFEVLKTGANDLLTVRRLRDKADELSLVDSAGASELRGCASALEGSFDAANEDFGIALSLLPRNSDVMVRWLAMLCVTGQAGKAKQWFLRFRSSFEGDLVAMGTVIRLLGYVGLLHEAYQLRERVFALGGNPGRDVFSGEFWIGAPPDLGIATPFAVEKFPDPLPCSVYTFSLSDAEEILADQGLSTDAWSEPMGCALRFLRQRQLKVVAVRTSFVPYDDRPTSMYFQLIVQAEPDVCCAAEWEFCGVLVEESFPIIDSGAASIAFIPTLLEASSAKVA